MEAIGQKLDNHVGAYSCFSSLSSACVLKFNSGSDLPPIPQLCAGFDMRICVFSFAIIYLSFQGGTELHHTESREAKV